MEYSVDTRPPLHLTFLVDVSGSMSSRDKLPLAKESMHMLIDTLREDDTVALPHMLEISPRFWTQPLEIIKKASMPPSTD